MRGATWLCVLAWWATGGSAAETQLPQYVTVALFTGTETCEVPPQQTTPVAFQMPNVVVGCVPDGSGTFQAFGCNATHMWGILSAGANCVALPNSTVIGPFPFGVCVNTNDLLGLNTSVLPISCASPTGGSLLPPARPRFLRAVTYSNPSCIGSIISVSDDRDPRCHDQGTSIVGYACGGVAGDTVYVSEQQDSLARASSASANCFAKPANVSALAAPGATVCLENSGGQSVQLICTADPDVAAGYTRILLASTLDLCLAGEAKMNVATIAMNACLPNGPDNSWQFFTCNATNSVYWACGDPSCDLTYCTPEIVTDVNNPCALTPGSSLPLYATYGGCPSTLVTTGPTLLTEIPVKLMWGDGDNCTGTPIGMTQFDRTVGGNCQSAQGTFRYYDMCVNGQLMTVYCSDANCTQQCFLSDTLEDVEGTCDHGSEYTACPVAPAPSVYAEIEVYPAGSSCTGTVTFVEYAAVGACYSEQLPTSSDSPTSSYSGSGYIAFSQLQCNATAATFVSNYIDQRCGARLPPGVLAAETGQAEFIVAPFNQCISVSFGNGETHDVIVRSCNLHAANIPQHTLWQYSFYGSVCDACVTNASAECAQQPTASQMYLAFAYDAPTCGRQGNESYEIFCTSGALTATYYNNSNCSGSDGLVLSTLPPQLVGCNSEQLGTISRLFSCASVPIITGLPTTTTLTTTPVPTTTTTTTTIGNGTENGTTATTTTTTRPGGGGNGRATTTIASHNGNELFAAAGALAPSLAWFLALTTVVGVLATIV